MRLDVRQKLVLMILPVMMMTTPRWARGQESPPAGTDVVIKAGASLKVDDKVVDTGSTHRIYKIEKSQGDWRWLVSGKIAGWAKATDIIPLSEAIDFYNAEIERNTHAAWPYYNRGLIHQDHKRIDQAFADYSSALRQDPKYVPALINRGNIWLIRKTPDRAIRDFSDALEADPRSILAHVNRGIAFQAKDDFDKALADYDAAIRLGLKTAAAFNNRGHVRQMKRDYDGAIADYDEAIRLDPAYALAWMNRGSARQARGNCAEALADYSESTRLNPNAPEGYARRAWVLATCADAAQRNGKEAVALADKAAEMAGPSAYYFLDVRAAAHAEAGDFTKAIASERLAIGLAQKRGRKDPDAAAEIDVYSRRLKLYEADQPYREIH
jgi:tetratricopeptide (TPR) repeat protein